mgnify:CR=1 FL=1
MRQALCFFLLILMIIPFSLALGFSSERVYLVFDKAQYRLEIKEGEKTLYSFEAGYGLKSPLYKTKKGDLLTPEGIYTIKSIRPSQSYFYFVELSYPNENDLSWAYFRGEFKGESYEETNQLGNEIGIHGEGPAKKEKGKRDLNWTKGCIALSNEDLKTLLIYVRPGQRVFLLNSSKPLFEILKKFAYPVKVKPLDFWEGELYLKLSNETYWYFHLLEKATGLKVLTFKEWIKGRLNTYLISEPDGTLNHEKKIKETLLKNLYFIIEPKYRGRDYLWR